jgi:hypothetical protein
MADKKAWFITGTDAIGIAEQKVADLEEHSDTICHLLTSPALDNPQSTRNRR